MVTVVSENGLVTLSFDALSHGMVRMSTTFAVEGYYAVELPLQEILDFIEESSRRLDWHNDQVEILAFYQIYSIIFLEVVDMENKPVVVPYKHKAVSVSATEFHDALLQVAQELPLN